MTPLFLSTPAALSSLTLGLRSWLGRLGRLIDRAVSARAARAVPEWQMKQIRSEIRRHVWAARLSREDRSALFAARSRPGRSGSVRAAPGAKRRPTPDALVRSR